MIKKPIAVITGGARGIGYQIASDLLKQDYQVVIGDLDEASTKAAATVLGPDATGVRLDITNQTLVAETIEHIETTLGPIAVWINNAGVMLTGRFKDQPITASKAVINIDYAGLVEATAAILPKMLERKEGVIINLASATGLKPLSGLAVYSGAKAAVIGFSDALRRELRGTGVTIRVILPNLVSTPMGAGITPPKLSPAVTPEQVSKAVVRAIHSGPFAVTVPRSLSPVLRLARLLPSSVQDWLDDRIGTDKIGLGGDPAVRAAYLKDINNKLEK